MTASELTEKVGAIDAELAGINAEIAAIKGSVPTTVEELNRHRQRLEELVKAAEESQRKADSEAHRAFLAKEACEGHAKTTAERKGQVEAEASAIGTLKANADEIVRSISALKTPAEEAIKSVNDAREIVSQTQISLQKLQPQLELDSKAVSEQRSLSEGLLQEIRRTQSDVKIAADEVSSQQKAAGTTIETIKQTKLDADDLLRRTKENNEGVSEIKKEAEKLKTELANVFQELNDRHTETLDYKNKLAVMTQEYDKLYKRIDGLLPHAASASLASAFRAQRKRFLFPQIGWLLVFIASIAMLVLLAIPDGSTGLRSLFTGATPAVVSSPSAAQSRVATDKVSAGNDVATSSLPITWDDILRQTARRLPLILPLVWLAIFAGRNYGLSIRLEEDYAYKEAVSTAFEGYKREMTEMTTAGGDKGSPLNTLCQNILNAIAQRPGRIYEGKHQDVTLLTPISGAIRDARGLRDRETSD